jgi:hypothetical protein
VAAREPVEGKQPVNADTALLVGLATLALAAVLAVPAIVRAWRLWRRGPPDFHSDGSANDRDW